MCCESCDKIVHAECAKCNFEYNHVNNSWQCCECLNSENLTYNPFSGITYDKYDPTNLNEIEDIAEISKLLESCQSLNRKKLNFQFFVVSYSEEWQLPGIFFRMKKYCS